MSGTHGGERQRQVAIVGGAASRTLAPYDDVTWDIWAFSSLRLHTPRITRWFEMHALGDLRTQLARGTKAKRSYTSYMRFLKGLPCPIVMQRVYNEIPNSVKYPLGSALKAFGRCFTSTAAYLIALAIMEGYETIGVWGIHLTARPVYARQKPGVEYLLGMAQKRGIRVILPADSPLRVPREPKMVRTHVLYGYDWRSPHAWWRRKKRLRHRRRRPRR